MVNVIGAFAINVTATTGAVALRIASALRITARGQLDARETLRHAHRFFVELAPLAVIASVAVGCVVGMQGLGYLQRYNATEVFGWAAGMSAFRDVGPLLLGFCLAARVGSRNAAELASMAARERLDALTALGLDPQRVVVMPRLVASIVVAACVYLPCSLIVVCVAFMVARVLGEQNLAVSTASLLEYVHVSALLEGWLRLTLFGAVIGVSSCHAGAAVTAQRSSHAIGRAVFTSGALCLCGVAIINLVVSVLGAVS